MEKALFSPGGRSRYVPVNEIRGSSCDHDGLLKEMTGHEEVKSHKLKSGGISEMMAQVRKFVKTTASYMPLK